MAEWKSADEKSPPPRGHRWVTELARIRDNSTGEVREIEMLALLEDGHDAPSDWGWSGGNYSCDCNRRLFFARAKGESEDWESDCGDGAYSVQIVNPVDGAAYYDEFAAEDAPPTT